MKIFIATYVTTHDVDDACDDIDRTTLVTHLAFARVYSSIDNALDAMIASHIRECVDLADDDEIDAPPASRDDVERIHDHEYSYANDAIIVYEHVASNTLYFIREIDTDHLDD